MATKPGNRIIGRAGMDYFRSEARRRLAVGDPLVPAFLAAARRHPSS
jgi:hypothetical protein